MCRKSVSPSVTRCRQALPGVAILQSDESFTNSSRQRLPRRREACVGGWSGPHEVLRHTFRAMYFMHRVDGPSSQPTDAQEHTLWSPCSRAHFGHVATACVSSPGDWAVSVGTHTQQDMGVSIAPPHLVAPAPLFEYCSRLKTTIQKIGDSVS